MKKFASILISVLLVFSTVFGIVVSADEDPSSQLGSLTLTKYETDSDKTTPVTGAKFTAYKVAELSSNGKYTPVEAYKNVSVTVSEGEQTKTWTLDDLMKQDDYTADKTGGGLTFTSTEIFEKMIPALQAVAQDKNNPQTGVVSTETEAGNYTFTNLPLGVYLVTETKVPQGYVVASQSFLVSIPEWDNENERWNYDVTASPKDTTINPEKKIVKDNKELDEDTVKVGDIVNYKVTAKIPYYGEVLPTAWTESEYYPTEEQFNAKLAQIKYNFIDTMSKGLTFNNDMVVKVDGVKTELSADTDYTLTTAAAANDATEIKAAFNWANINQYQGKTVTFTYSAVVNEKAVIGSPNNNTAKVQYNSDPRVEEDPVDSEPSSTKVYTYGMDLTKYFNNAPATSDIDASKVEFSLKIKGEKQWFITKESGKYIEYSPEMVNPAVSAAEGKEVTINNEKYTITQKLNPTREGALSVDGLNVGTYTLTEEKSVEKFSKLASDVEIVVSADKDANNKLTGKVIAKVGDTTLDTAEDNLGKFLFTVNNVSKQFDLPLTGGMGILIFTVGGGIVIAAAIIIFSQLRKKKNNSVK